MDKILHMGRYPRRSKCVKFYVDRLRGREGSNCPILHRLEWSHGHIKTTEQRTIIQQCGTLAVDGWAVRFGTARRGLGGPQEQLGLVLDSAENVAWLG